MMSEIEKYSKDLFADNDFVHSGIEPILRLTSYINVIYKKWILEENAKKE